MKLWVNQERTLLVRQYDDGQLEVARREASHYTWGPPIRMELEEPRPARTQEQLTSDRMMDMRAAREGLNPNR